MTECRDRYSFLSELAHYEWIEVAVQKALPKPLAIGFQPIIPITASDLAQMRPIWNPNMALAVYNAPIPLIIDVIVENEDDGSCFEALLRLEYPLTCCPTLIYRKPESLTATFFVLTPLMAAYYQATQSSEMSYRMGFDWLREHVPSIAAVDDGVLFAQGLAMISQAFDEQILLGSQCL